jgi:hypothetical protein
MEKIKLEELKTKREKIHYIARLRTKALKLAKRMDKLEVIPKYRISGYDPETKEPLIEDMTQKLKKELFKHHKDILSRLANFFDDALRNINNSLDAWNDIKEFAGYLEKYEKEGSEFFREKGKAKKSDLNCRKFIKRVIARQRKKYGKT